MNASLRALLASAIDFVFPPTGLPLNQAIRKYARYRQGAEAWMLGRFVLPATNLPELQVEVDDVPTCLALLGGTGSSMGGVLVSLQRDMQILARFRNEFKGRAQVRSLDIKVQLLMPDFAALVVNGVLQVIDKQANAGMMPFLEASSHTGCRPAYVALFPLIGRSACNNGDRAMGVRKPIFCESPGVKVCCGGQRASDIPTPDDLAFAIIAGCEHRVPLKFTTGLQHPIRHHDAKMRTMLHGFLNVFGAGVLAHARKLGQQQVREIIEDEDPSNFIFDEETFRWKDLSATVEEIELARRMAITSFSCYSVNDPCEDLHAMGLLP